MQMAQKVAFSHLWNPQRCEALDIHTTTHHPSKCAQLLHILSSFMITKSRTNEYTEQQSRSNATKRNVIV